MGLIELTRELWAPVALAAVVLGGVALAFTQCAVAELVLRAAAWLYVKNGFVRRDKFVEWRAELRAMKASERPAHAATLLWEGFIRFVMRSPERQRLTGRARAFDLLSRSQITLVVELGVEIPASWDESTDTMTILAVHGDSAFERLMAYTSSLKEGDSAQLLLCLRVVR